MLIELNRRGLAASKTAVFRVDAGPDIGMGHFMRCRTLAFELVRRNWVVFFVGSGLPGNLFTPCRGRVNGIINLIEFGPHVTSADDAKVLLELLMTKSVGAVDCLIIDTYVYNRGDFAYLQRFGRGRFPVLVIDDLANRDTPAQAVLNPNPLFAREPYERQKIPHILCGEQYTLIRPEITALRERVYNDTGLIMVTMGGGNVVAPLMRVLRSIPSEISNRICVSVSPACPLDAINEWISLDPVMRFLNTDSRLFPELLANSAFAITGGGTTLWETYCIGVPSLCLVWVANQKQASVVIQQQATSFLIDIAEQINQGLQSSFIEEGIKSLRDGVVSASEVRRRELEGYSASEVIRRDKTSFLVDSESSVNIDFISQILREFKNVPEQRLEMMRKQRALIDGGGVVRCADLLETLEWQAVDLLAADWRQSYEDW